MMTIKQVARVSFVSDRIRRNCYLLIVCKLLANEPSCSKLG